MKPYELAIVNFVLDDIQICFWFVGVIFMLAMS